MIYIDLDVLLFLTPYINSHLLNHPHFPSRRNKHARTRRFHVGLIVRAIERQTVPVGRLSIDASLFSMHVRFLLLVIVLVIVVVVVVVFLFDLAHGTNLTPDE